MGNMTYDNTMEDLTLNSSTGGDMITVTGAPNANLTINSAAGTDTLTINGSFTVSGTVDINAAENILDGVTGGTVTANALEIDAATMQLGLIADQIKIDVNTLEITNSGNVDAFITELDGLDLLEISVGSDHCRLDCAIIRADGYDAAVRTIAHSIIRTGRVNRTRQIDRRRACCCYRHGA